MGRGSAARERLGEVGAAGRGLERPGSRGEAWWDGVGFGQVWRGSKGAVRWGAGGAVGCGLDGMADGERLGRCGVVEHGVAQRSDMDRPGLVRLGTVGTAVSVGSGGVRFGEVWTAGYGRAAEDLFDLA